MITGKVDGDKISVAQFIAMASDFIEKNKSVVKPFKYLLVGETAYELLLDNAKSKSDISDIKCVVIYDGMKVVCNKHLHPSYMRAFTEDEFDFKIKNKIQYEH